MDRYLIHGLQVQCEVPLPEAVAPGTEEPVDVDIRRGGEEVIGFAPPDGALLLEQPFGDFGLGVAEHGGEFVMRFYGLCEFRVRGEREVEVWRQPDVGEDVAAALLVAGLLPCLLVRRDCRLLHASAVHHEGRTIALAGGTGAGKSTLAAQMCAEGAELVTDDVLRIEGPADELVCHRGTARILLHSGDTALANRFPAALRQPCWDGRIAVAPPTVAEPVLPLDEIRQLSDDPGSESWQLLVDGLR